MLHCVGMSTNRDAHALIRTLTASASADSREVIDQVAALQDLMNVTSVLSVGRSMLTLVETSGLLLPPRVKADAPYQQVGSNIKDPKYV